MKNILYYIVCVLFIFPAPDVFAIEIHVGFSNPKPPYVTADEKKPGIEVEIVREAFKHAGYTISPQYATYPRITAELIKGNLAAAASVWPKKGVGKLFFSNSIFSFKNMVFTLKSRGIKINKIQDLTNNYSIVAWRGARNDLGEEFFRYFNPEIKSKYIRNYYENSQDEALVKMFWSDHADVIIMDTNIFYYLSANFLGHQVPPDGIQVHDIFSNDRGWYVGFNDPKIRDDFNIGLKTILDNGMYNELFKKYLNP